MSKKISALSCALLIIITLSTNGAAKPAAVDKSRPVPQRSKTDNDLVRATNQYKQTVQTLIPQYEQNIKTATEALEKRKELLAKGLVSKLEVDNAQRAVDDAKKQLEDAKHSMVESDQLLAEAVAEATKPSPTGRYTTNAAVMRYSGVGGWAISEASKIENYFATKFGRQLPISALGQSATHNRLGFDHRNSVDVALHPDSAEGKALMDYLRENGIPYLAFRSAIPGVATGAHIHIGYPSHRI